MIVIGVWLVNLAAAMLIGLASRGTLVWIFAALQSKADAQAAAFSPAWWSGYTSHVNGVSTALTSGAAVVSALGNASVPGRIGGETVMVAAGIGGWLIVRAVLFGGILQRYARDTATTGLPFFAACRQFAGRMLRAGLIGGVAYVLLYTGMDVSMKALGHGGMPGFGGLVVLVIAALALLAIDLLVDLACVRTVLEDRRSVLGAYLAGWRLLIRRPGTITGVYAIAMIALFLWFSVRIVAVPTAIQSRVELGSSLLADQVFAFGELALSLVPAVALIGIYRDTLTKELS